MVIIEKRLFYLTEISFVYGGMYKMRVFFAIEFDDEIKKYIKEIQDIIRENSLRGNFSREDNFHLTLKFIGEADGEILSRLKSSLDMAIQRIDSFSLNLKGLGTFTKESRRIVWIGIKNEDRGLGKLYASLEDSLYKNGFARDIKGYSPHITLSRETLFKAGFEKELCKITVIPKEINISRVSLMESTRINGKLTYKAIYVKDIQAFQ